MKTVIHYKAGPYLPITETWIYKQIKNLKRYCPIVYATSTENLDIYPTAKIRSLGLKKGLKKGLKDPYTLFNKSWNMLFNFYPYFVFSLIKDKPSFIHAHFGPSGYNFLILKKIFRLSVIISFYGYDLSFLPVQYPKWLIRYKKLFQEGELFLVEGSYMKKCLLELGCPKEKIIVQHLGVDLDQIKFVPRKLDEDEEIKILISSSFREKKGIPYAVEAFGRVKQTYPNLKLKLTIIGDSGGSREEEEEKEKIFNMIQKYNLRDCVNILGYQVYSIFLRELYKHHIFLHPSVHASDNDTEGGVPVSIIEASASGMPILSTTHCDIPEVVINEESGYLVSEKDVDALVEKLEFLILNSDLWRNMGLCGREHIRKNYNIKEQVRKLEKIYDKVLMKLTN